MGPPTIHSMYYVAILCPGNVEDKVYHFKRWVKEQFGCTVALKSPAHITLIAPFWLEETREEELLQALQSFASDKDELKIEISGFSHFSNRVIFVQVNENPELEELQNQTQNHFYQSFREVIKKDVPPFHPHITIANRDLKPGDFEKAWLHFSNREYKETFSTKTVSLLKLSMGKWVVIGSTIW